MRKCAPERRERGIATLPSPRREVTLLQVGGQMRVFRKTSLRLAAAVAAGILAAQAGAQDFSDLRMRGGEAAYRARRFADAASMFRVAAFGYLDRPPLLCQALVHLALAYDAAGRPAEAKVAADRLAEAQRRAPTCADAEIDAATRLEFETRFRRKWPPAGTASAAASADLSPAPPASQAVDTAAEGPRPTREARRTTPKPVAETAPSSDAAAEGESAARLKTVVHPIYPRAALQARVGGVVILRVLVSEEGTPLQVEVVQGIRPDLNAAAVTAIKRCIFEPARVAGRPGRASTTVGVPFQP